MTAEEPDEELIARNVFDVHGTEAATVARDNARRAALAGQAERAKSWIRVLGIIQRHQINKAAPIAGAGQPASFPPAPKLKE